MTTDNLKELDALEKCWEKSVSVKVTKSYAEIRCNKGLWSVSGKTFTEELLAEAVTYFSQYYLDGEYDE